ncbi:MAG: hypothetical protein M1162_02600 [Candidatus Thermoplasmatota archaeon]|nr:hypothetical protein [Candidatus Thermoplasmatota archaeon]
MDSSPDVDPGDYARSSSDFIEWLEAVIKNGIVDEGDQTIPGKTCIINVLSNENEDEETKDLIDALSLFSDFRIKELLGVSIFSE